jgi:hypothetical protein
MVSSRRDVQLIVSTKDYFGFFGQGGSTTKKGASCDHPLSGTRLPNQKMNEAHPDFVGSALYVLARMKYGILQEDSSRS